MAMFGLPHWQLKSTSTESGVVAPDERLPFAQTAVMGVQHAVAMFGATVLMPITDGAGSQSFHFNVRDRHVTVFLYYRRARAQLSRLQRGFCWCGDCCNGL